MVSMSPQAVSVCDTGLCAAQGRAVAKRGVSHAEDPKLVAWSKVDAPFLALPPPGLPLTGWRDPFVIQRGNGKGKPWIILMGAGLPNEGGTSLIYTAPDLGSPWEYSGLLCLGDPSLGAMWECPLLWEVAPAPRIGGGRGARARGAAGAGFVNVGGSGAGDGADADVEAAQLTMEVELGLHIFANPEPAAMQVRALCAPRGHHGEHMHACTQASD